MAQLKRYNGTSWETIGGSIAPKNTHTVSTTATYSCDYVNGNTPSKTSDLTNDSDFVVDASYVHTDNNFTGTLKDKLDGIASGAEVNVQSDWNQTTTTADDYIKNKPTIPTVNNATLTIQKNGTTVKTFTANASSNVTANITVPDITGGTGYVKYSDGTMICWGSKTGTTTYSDFWGLVKRSPEGNSAIQVSLPQSFKDKTYSVQLTPLYSSTTIFCAQEGDNYKATNSFRVVCFTPTGNGSNSYGFLWMAVGKWK